MQIFTLYSSQYIFFPGVFFNFPLSLVRFLSNANLDSRAAGKKTLQPSVLADKFGLSCKCNTSIRSPISSPVVYSLFSDCFVVTFEFTRLTIHDRSTGTKYYLHGKIFGCSENAGSACGVRGAVCGLWTARQKHRKNKNNNKRDEIKKR